MTIGTGATATSDSRWSERNIRYDLDGNILHLERYQGNANTPQATLDFSYDGPKRNGYSYDSNGNITYDPLRCFEIRYNLLNLAAEVIGHDPEDTAAEGTLLCETVYYADGTRSGVRLPNDGPWLTRYVSSLICDGDSEFLYPMGVVSDFGYIDLQSGKMQYFLRDHLGSVRVIAEDRHTVISRTDYLPFGVRMSGDGLTAGNPTARSSFFGFSGKENEMWGGYDTADGDITPHWLKGERYQHFGARAYDPVSCIFMQVDPMAEKYYGMTPYAYCSNNTINRIDPFGQADYFNETGEFLYRDKFDDGDIRIIKQNDYLKIQKEPDSFEIHLIVYSSTVTSAYKAGLISDKGMVSLTEHYNKTGVPLIDSSGAFQMESNNKTDDQHFQIEINVSRCVESNIFDTYDNLDNAINAHEGYHINEMKKDPWKYDRRDKIDREYSAYKAQIESSSWRKATQAFKNKILDKMEIYELLYLLLFE